MAHLIRLDRPRQARRYRPGEREEEMACVTFRSLGCLPWCTGGTMAMTTLPGGRRVPINLGHDIYGLFDIVARRDPDASAHHALVPWAEIDAIQTHWAQIKGGRSEQKPAARWMAAVEAFPLLPGEAGEWWSICPDWSAWTIWVFLPGSGWGVRKVPNNVEGLLAAAGR